VYFSGYSFAIGHLGTTDMDLYSNVEIADAARRTVSALRKFQLTMAVGDPEKGVAPKHLDIPPVIVDMDGGYGNIFNVQRTTELYVSAGVAAAHIEDQVLPKRCGHIGGKALIPVSEMVGKLRMARAVADDLGNRDFVIIARTDAYGAVGGSMEEAIWRGRAYADAGVDLVWAELSNSEREPAIEFARAMKQSHPNLPLAFNYSSSFRWHKDPNPLTFRELGELGYRFIFITLFGAHAAMYSVWNFMQELVKNEEQAQWTLERQKVGHPTESHHVMARVSHFQELERRYIPGTDERLKGSDGFGEAKSH